MIYEISLLIAAGLSRLSKLYIIWNMRKTKSNQISQNLFCTFTKQIFNYLYVCKIIFLLFVKKNTFETNQKYWIFHKIVEKN